MSLCIDLLGINVKRVLINPSAYDDSAPPRRLRIKSEIGLAFISGQDVCTSGTWSWLSMTFCVAFVAHACQSAGRVRPKMC